MSRIGKLPVIIPENIKINIVGNIINFDNGKVKKEYKVTDGINVKFFENKIYLTSDKKIFPDSSMFLGMDRSNIKNIVLGMQTDFKTVLEINGVGYKASVDKNLLILTLGYSHEIVYALPNGINAVFEKPNLIVITGNDKIMVGQIASEIISFRKPEPYKGKGVKLFGKAILRKEGKKK